MDTPDYVSDVAYAAHYHANQAPATLRFVCALNGVAPPELRPGFTYCDVGCGPGVNVVAFAEANPAGHFWGVDLLPEHIRYGRALADAGDVRNAAFLEADIAAVPDDALPSFDFIALRGVYTWVSPAVRRALEAFVARHLVPGGLLYIAYNTVPGWYPLRPLRDAIHAYTAHMEGDTTAKARRALDYLRFLRERRAPYFEQVGAASRLLDQLLESELSYVAHEVFNPHWEPIYFRDLVDALAPHDLHFVGSLPLHMNDPGLSVPEGLEELLATAPDRLTTEAHRDVLIHETFREDVFVKGPPRPDADGAAMRHTVFAAPAPRHRQAPTATLRFREVALRGPVFEAALDALDEGPGDVAALRARHPALAEHDEGHLTQALVALALMERAVPCSPAGGEGGAQAAAALTTQAPPVGAPEGEGPRLHEALNRALLKRQLWRGTKVLLVSRRAGTGIELEGLDAFALAALDNSAPGDELAWMERTLARASHPPRGEDGQPMSDEQLREHLRQGLARFRTSTLPYLERLGIVRPA